MYTEEANLVLELTGYNKDGSLRWLISLKEN